MQHALQRVEMHANFWLENQSEGDSLEDLTQDFKLV
jgi:hypothetical protein